MPGLPRCIEEFTRRFKENIGTMFPRAVLNPTWHMEKFLDTERGKKHIEEGHVYAITERGRKPLPDNDAAHGMRLIGAELVQYCAITDNGSIVTMFPASCVDGLTLLFEWLATVTAMVDSGLFFAKSSMRQNVINHCSIIIGALNASIEAANVMWSLGIMTPEWIPWQLALIITYWNVFGDLETSSWMTLVKDHTETWMKISVSPHRDGLMYRTTSELRGRGTSMGSRESLVNTYFLLWKDIASNRPDGRLLVPSHYPPRTRHAIEKMNILRMTILCPALAPQEAMSQLESYALSCIKICRHRYLPYGKDKMQAGPLLDCSAERWQGSEDQMMPSHDVAKVGDDPMSIYPPADENFPESNIRSSLHTSSHEVGTSKGKCQVYQSSRTRTDEHENEDLSEGNLRGNGQPLRKRMRTQKEATAQEVTPRSCGRSRSPLINPSYPGINEIDSEASAMPIIIMRHGTTSSIPK
ncbi:hypothetical protein QCA50_012586 [Cerrena zonata]|uniref:Uncharacterized protein n=1 Tax=Cerrena zonata TaxID=2478898 RepID=A0AAW0FVT2_9APHY